MLDQIISRMGEYGQLIFDYLSSPIILVQLGVIAILIVPALLLAKRTKPLIEDRARSIKGCLLYTSDAADDL